MRRVALLSAVLLAGCASVDWQAPPADVPAEWREWKLFAGERAWILTHDEGAAVDAYYRVVDVVQTIRESTGTDPGLGLVVALHEDDAPLSANSAMHGVKASKFFAKTMGQMRARSEDGPPLDEDELAALGVTPDRLDKVVPLRVDPADDTLDVPLAIRERVDWVVVAPTEDCTYAVVSDVIDASLELADVSFAQRLLITPLLPIAKGRITSEMQARVIWVLAHTCAAAVGMPAADVRPVALRCVEAAGYSTETFEEGWDDPKRVMARRRGAASERE